MIALSRCLKSTITMVMMVALAAIVLLTFVDVLGRVLLNSPLYGAHDLTEHLMACLIFLGCRSCLRLAVI